jgi:hypothetical protein
MHPRLIPLLLAALAGALPLAGCGGGKSTSTQSTQAGPASSTIPAGGAAGSGGTTAPGATSPAGGAAVASEVAACKAAIAGAPSLSPALKTKVEAICDKAASGDVAGARKAAREVCSEVINAAPAAAAVKELARARCSKL